MFRRVQDLEILLHGGRFAAPGGQLVVGHAEPGRGVHVLDVFVVHKRARLADQRVDHMAEVDRFLALAKQARHPFQAFVPVPQLQVVLFDMHLHRQADVLAAHRVGVALDPQNTVLFHGHRNDGEGIQTLRGQRSQHSEFFPEGHAPRSVSPSDQLLDEGHVLLDVVKVPVAANQQRLVQCRLQVAVGGFDITVLMRFLPVDAMAPHAVMRKQ